MLSPDDIQLVPFGVVPVTGSLAASSTPTNVTVNTFDILSDVTTSGTSGYGFAVSSSDATAGDFLTVEISQGSSIAGESGFNGVNLTTTAGANIALINAGTITASVSGSSAINTSSGAGSTIVADYGNGAGAGNLTGAANGIIATTTTGQINVVINSGATITGTSKFGISAVTTGGNVIVNTSPGDTITGGTSGINAQDTATSVSNSSISISVSGTIDSGAQAATATNDPAAVRVAYTNGTADTPTTAVSGNITINSNANLNATWGSGLYAFDYGLGNISITDGSGTTITTSTAAPPAGSSQYGIGAFAYETGNTNVDMAFGSTITSGSTGINAVNQATATTSTSSVTVIAQGTIDSGANGTNSGNTPAGIQAGFDPYDPTTKNNTNTFDSSVLGDVLINLAGGRISAAAGLGLKAINYGVGNVVVEVQSGSSITAQTSSALANGAPYGIGAFNYGPGNIAVTMNGSTITSGSSGIDAVNEGTTTVGYANPTVTVTASGTINAGSIPTNLGLPASGIATGFLGSPTAETANTAVTGSVVVNNSANINVTNGSPSSYGINAFNYGNGDVTVGDAATTVIGSVTGIQTAAASGGAGDIAINLAANASVTGTTDYGIAATSLDTGNISVTTSSGDTITSGSAGIDAVSEATALGADSSITVNASGTINPGSALTASGHAPAGIVASYDPGLTNAPPVGVSAPDDISITDFATINASSAGIDGIRSENYGTGTITVLAEAGATINAGEYGIAAIGYDGGDVSVTNYAAVTGNTAAIDATTTGTVIIDNYGNLIGDVISNNATFTNEVGGLWSLDGLSTFTGASTLLNDGKLQSTQTSEIFGLSDINNSGTIEVQSGSLKLDSSILGTGTLKIDAGATLELAAGVTSTQTVVFSSTTGTLKLDQAENFSGVISGFTTTDGTLAHSDQIDLADINHHSPSFSELFNSATDILTVTDGTNTAVIQFSGTIGTLNFVDDGSLVDGVSGTSGTIVYDPPSTNQNTNEAVVRDHTQLHNVVLAGAQNQTAGGFAVSDNFAFNFDHFRHADSADFHPPPDAYPFGKTTSVNALAASSASPDQGYSFPTNAADDHDPIGGALKAHMHAADYHIV